MFLLFANRTIKRPTRKLFGSNRRVFFFICNSTLTLGNFHESSTEDRKSKQHSVEQLFEIYLRHTRYNSDRYRSLSTDAGNNAIIKEKKRFVRHYRRSWCMRPGSIIFVKKKKSHHYLKTWLFLQKCVPARIPWSVVRSIERELYIKTTCTHTIYGTIMLTITDICKFNNIIITKQVGNLIYICTRS